MKEYKFTIDGVIEMPDDAIPDAVYEFVQDFIVDAVELLNGRIAFTASPLEAVDGGTYS